MHRRKQRIGNGDIPVPEPPERSHYRRRNRRRDFAHVKPAGIPAQKDSLFIFSPKHILQVQSNNRFKAHLIVIAPDFLKRINIDTKRMMPLFLQFGSLPCMELTQAESQSLRSFISMVEQELKGSETDFRARSSAD